jgi:hypothetical protein
MKTEADITQNFVSANKTIRCHVSADRSVRVRLFRLPVQNSSSGVDL